MRTLDAEERRHLEASVAQYQQDLAEHPQAQQYLISRGFTPEAAQFLRYGVVGHPLAGHERYRERMVIPYLTPSGVVNMRFRCVKDHDHGAVGCPKYLSLDAAGSNLYGVLDLKKDSPFICITEGEIDRDTLSVLCGLPAVGVPGVKTWAKHFSRCLEDFDVVYAFGDGDEAGGKFSSFLAKEARARPISMPKGSDVNDVYRSQGADGVRRLIAE